MKPHHHKAHPTNPRRMPVYLPSDIEAAFLHYLRRAEINSIQLELRLDDQDAPDVRNILNFMVDPDSGRIVRIPQSAVSLYP